LNKDILVIVMSGKVNEDVKTLSMLTGAEDLLKKPIDMKNFSHAHPLSGYTLDTHFNRNDKAVHSAWCI